MSHFLHRTLRWLAQKTAPRALAGPQWTGSSYVDAFKRNREPTPNELMQELKNTAFTCASINAGVCAAYPPRLYVATNDDQPPPRQPTRNLNQSQQKRLRNLSWLPRSITKAQKLQEIVEHPILALFDRPNPFFGSFDLWELTTLYLEVHGSAYWYLDIGILGIPDSVWVMPSQNVTPRRKPQSPNIVDYYEYRTGAQAQQFPPEQIIHFRYPDPRNPYTAGLSPLRAAFESCSLMSDYTAFKSAKFENRAIPDAIVSPDEFMAEEERSRVEGEWNQRFRRGGAGKVLVAESALKVQLLNHSIGDLAALAEAGATKEDIANAFHVPLAFLKPDTNLANLQASEQQHMSKAIDPRLQRRDEKINAQLIPLYDPSGRLFVASDDPVPLNQDAYINQLQADLKFGVICINEIRQDRGLDPVEWGNTPWLPLMWGPTDMPQRHIFAPHAGTPRTGRGKPVETGESQDADNEEIST